jgi:hypothetical protein
MLDPDRAAYSILVGDDRLLATFSFEFLDDYDASEVRARLQRRDLVSALKGPARTAASSSRHRDFRALIDDSSDVGRAWLSPGCSHGGFSTELAGRHHVSSNTSRVPRFGEHKEPVRF